MYIKNSSGRGFSCCCALFVEWVIFFFSSIGGISGSIRRSHHRQRNHRPLHHVGVAALVSGDQIHILKFSKKHFWDFQTGHVLPLLMEGDALFFYAIKVDLENEIMKAVKEGYTTFITGMACGTDIWAGNIVARLKDRFPGLKLIAAVPFPQFPDGWTPEWREKYTALLERADFVKTIAGEYSPGAYQQRNEWMVDHSNRVIAVYDGKAGGTRDTLQYARKTRINVRYLRG